LWKKTACDDVIEHTVIKNKLILNVNH
jgi:hypothetical protein